MKFSFALIASAVFATQSPQYVSVNPTPNLSARTCFKVDKASVPSENKNPIQAALIKSFQDSKIPADVTFKQNAGNNVQVDVTIKLPGIDSASFTIGRAKAFVNVIGTLNLNLPQYKLKFNLNYGGLTHDFFPTGVYTSREATSARRTALAGCNVAFPK
jgi:hypothetical protein